MSSLAQSVAASIAYSPSYSPISGPGESASLRPVIGWTGPQNCSSVDATKVNVQFTKEATYSTTPPNGVVITAQIPKGPEQSPDANFNRGASPSDPDNWRAIGAADIYGGQAHIPKYEGAAFPNIRTDSGKSPDIVQGVQYEVDIDIESMNPGTIEFWWNDAVLLGSIAASGTVLLDAGGNTFNSLNVYYDGTGTAIINSLSIREPAGTLKTFTISSVSASPSQVVEYTGSWDSALVTLDEAQFAYSGGDYADDTSKLMKDTTLGLINCD